MEKTKVRDLVGAGLVSILGGCGVGATCEWINSASLTSETQQVIEISACAPHLGPVHVNKESLPPSCYPLSPSLISWHYNEADKVVYSIPSSKQLINDEPSIQTKTEEQNDQILHSAEVTGAATTVGIFGWLALISRINRSAGRKPQLKLVK